MASEARPWDRHHVAVLAGFVALGTSAGTWGARIPDIKAGLGLSEGSLGTALLVLSIGAVAGAWGGGWLLRPWGAQPVVRGAWLALAATMPLPGLADSWRELAAALALQGLAIGVLDVSVNGAGVLLEVRTRRPLMNGLHGGWSAGVLLGAATAAVAVVSGVSVAAQLTVAGAAVGVAALAFWGGVPAGRIGGGSHPDGGSGTAGGGSGARRLLALAAIGGALFLAEGALLDWSGVLVRETLDGGEVLGVLAVNGVAAGGLIGRMAGDRLTDRSGPAPVIRVGVLVAATAIALVLVLPAATPAPLLILVAGAGMGPAVPLAFAAAGRLRGASGIATVTTAGYGCYLAGPAVIGWIADHVGLRVALAVPVALVASVALLAWSTEVSGGGGPSRCG